MTFQTGHIGLNVNDLNRSIQFYQQVFDLELKGKSETEGREYAMLGYDKLLVLTLWRQSDQRFANSIAGLHHLSFQVDSIEDVMAVQRKLIDLNAKFIHDGIVPHAEGSNSGGIFFEDPDGIRLEIFTATGAKEYAAPTNGPSCGFF